MGKGMKEINSQRVFARGKSHEGPRGEIGFEGLAVYQGQRNVK